MTSSLCPHLVQEYFERVSDILTTYRSQILKQVVYDKISENLVLRGAIRQEEHERIFQYEDLEGQVNQMLIVIQNRMWGLENLLAAFMEEHMSPWLTQEMFRAYMEHLVNPLKKQRDSQVCQCVQISNSILYRGWINVLKSLDTWIFKTGTSLGFVRQTMHPTDNLLAFLNDKLAEYTGGDSVASQDDLVPYGFASGTSGEVQVAELEEDDINDLISLSETLSIAFHANEDTHGRHNEIRSHSDRELYSREVNKDVKEPIVEEPAPENKVVKPKQKSNSRPPLDPNRRRKSIAETLPPSPQPDSNTQASNEKLLKQREMIARLSAPKTASNVRLRHSNSVDKVASQERPRSAEMSRSVSVASPSSISSGSASNLSKSDKASGAAATTGKTTGFVRAKNTVPSSPKSRSSKLSSNSKPTGVTKPNFKVESKSEICTNDDVTKEGDSRSKLEEAETSDTQYNSESEEPSMYVYDDNELSDASSGISSLLLKNTILAPKNRAASEGDQDKNFDYYQLSYHDILSDEED